METVREKYDNFKRTLNDMVREEHFDLISPIMRLQVEDILLLIKSEGGTLEECEQSILSAMGFGSGVIDTYSDAEVTKMKRYLEYFYKVSEKV